MVSVNHGHISFHGLPVQIISEIGVAITALLADAPEKVRPSMREIMNHCFDVVTRDESIEMFLDNRDGFVEMVVKDTDLFTMLSVFRELQDGLKAMKEQEDDE